MSTRAQVRGSVAVASLIFFGVCAHGNAGCSKPAKDIAGIGPWSITKTRLHSATGRCQPTDLPDGRKGSWCFGQAPVGLAGSPAEVDLYFDGVGNDANLIELQLKVRGCVETRLDSWMHQQFGAPIENKATRGYWQNGTVFVAALMPSEPGQCLVRMLPLSEQSEIARIRAQP